MRAILLAVPLALAFAAVPRPTPTPVAPDGDADERPGRPVRFVAPASEMRKLAALSGAWDFKETWREPARYKRGDYEGFPGAGGYGTLTVRPGPGGFSVLFDYEARNPMGHVTALEVLSWDPWRRLFELDEIHGAFPGVLHLTGRFEKGDLVFRGQDSRTGEVRAVRLVWKGLGEDTWRASWSAAGEHGRMEEVVAMELHRAPAR
ncbi:MAG TPA: hypothetical protein VN032_10805 [Thermoanaerobaculia bacterium]|jgi:hypothetical protein|nr:hypothetical protein [Thermoanaerobaculia bacterium]